MAKTKKKGTARKFNGTITEALTVQKVLVKRLRQYRETLVLEDTTLTEDRLDEFEDRLEDFTEEFVGLDANKELRGTTQTIGTQMAIAIKLVIKIENRIKRRFADIPALRDEILRQLGFSDYYEKASKGNQESMVSLLSQLRKNLSPGYRPQLLAKGIPDDNLNTLTQMAPNLDGANVLQEAAKGSRTVLTEEKTIALNLLYNEIMDHVVEAAKTFSGQVVTKALFAYNPCLQRLKSGLHSKEFNEVLKTQSLQPENQ